MLYSHRIMPPAFAGSIISSLAYPQLALWATGMIASFAGSGLFFSNSGSRDRPGATGAKAHGLTCSFCAALKGRSPPQTCGLRAALPPLKCRNSSASFAGFVLSNPRFFSI